MPTEIFSVCALPYSCASGDAFQVSLFVSPKLTPDQPSDELRRVSLFPHWGELVKQHMTVELTDQAGPIEAAALLAGVKPAVWDAAFPPETPVKGQPVPEWQGRRWRTFDARKVHDLGKAVHLATMYASPTSPPMPADHPLAGPLAELSGRYYRIEQLTEFTRRRIYDESLMTADLDELVESGESPAVIGRVIASEQPWLRSLALELHRTRRFYERPEEAGNIGSVRVDGAVPPPLPRPEPEFHERCAMAGDHPTLLRQLGLVIDLKVADPDRLRSSEWLSASLAIDGDLGPAVSRARSAAPLATPSSPLQKPRIGWTGLRGLATRIASRYSIWKLMGPRSSLSALRLCHASRRSKPKARTALRTQQRLPCAPMASPSFVSGKLKTHSNAWAGSATSSRRSGKGNRQPCPVRMSLAAFASMCGTTPPSAGSRSIRA